MIVIFYIIRNINILVLNDEIVLNITIFFNVVSTRVNNVSQSARLFTFCVLGQSECAKLTKCKHKERENSTLFADLRAIRY